MKPIVIATGVICGLILVVPKPTPSMAGAGGWYIDLNATRGDRQYIEDNASPLEFHVFFYVLACKDGTYSYHPHNCDANGGFSHKFPVSAPSGPVGLVSSVQAGGYGRGSNIAPYGISATASISVSGQGNVLSHTAAQNDEGGNARFTLDSDVAESKTVTVSYSYTDENGAQVSKAAKAITFLSRSSSSAAKPASQIGKATKPSPPQLTTEVRIGSRVFEVKENFVYKEKEALVISGKTVPNGEVTLYIFSEPQTASAIADGQGNWSYEVSGLESGDHRIEAEVKDPKTGLVSDRTQLLAFTVQPNLNPLANLPEPVAAAFPYWLFALLALNILTMGTISLYTHIQNRRLQLLYLDQKRQAANQDNFLRLVSHNLRTPLAIMKAGLEMLAQSDKKHLEKTKQLQSYLDDLSEREEGLIKGAARRLSINQNVNAKKSGWRQVLRSPLFWLPMLVVGLCVVLFQNLNQNYAGISAGTLNLLTQVALFLGLGSMFGAVLQQYFYRRNLHKLSRGQLENQIQLRASKQDLIYQIGTLLAIDVKHISEMLKGFPAGNKYVKNCKEGLAELEGLVNNLGKLSMLEQPSEFQSLTINQAAQNVLRKEDGEKVKLAGQSSLRVSAEFESALQPVISNAVKYGQKDKPVMVTISDRPFIAVIEITNYGSIDPETAKSLTDPFAAPQALESTGTQLGLGLYQAKLVSDRLGVKMSIRSEQGQTIARFEIPKRGRGGRLLARQTAVYRTATG